MSWARSTFCCRRLIRTGTNVFLLSKGVERFVQPDGRCAPSRVSCTSCVKKRLLGAARDKAAEASNRKCTAPNIFAALRLERRCVRGNGNHWRAHYIQFKERYFLG